MGTDRIPRKAPGKRPKRRKPLFQLVCVIGPRAKTPVRRGRPRRMNAGELARQNDTLMRVGASCYWKPTKK